MVEDEKQIDKELEELEKKIKAVSTFGKKYITQCKLIEFTSLSYCVVVNIIIITLVSQAKYVNSALKQEIKDLDNGQEQVTYDSL